MSEDIKSWLNSQPYWLQLAAHKSVTDTGITDDAIAEIAEALKAPPDSPEPFDFPNIGTVVNTVENLVLNSIGPLKGIDALNPRTPLDFGNHQLSVVYGSNGSGKSGFTRILKKASGKAGAKELKGNIFEASPEQQECTFSYTLNGTQKDVTWPANSDPVEDLKALDLFDTAAGEIYLKNETELSYTPPELSLFEALVDITKRVELRLKDDVEKLRNKLPPIPAGYNTTTASKTYSELKHTTETSKVCTWAESDENELAALKKRLDAKDPATESKQLRGQKKQCESIIKAVGEVSQLLSKKAYQEFIEKLREAAKTRKSASESAAALRDQAPLEGVGTETWRALWIAARNYSLKEAYPDETPPNTKVDARCVFCQQELDPEAQDRLTAFERYISGTLETNAAEAEKAVQEQLDGLPKLPTPESIETTVQAANLDNAQKDLLNRFWDEAQNSFESFNKKDPEGDAVDLTDKTTALLQALTTYSEQLEKNATQLDADAKDFDRAKAQNELKEFEARKWIADQADAVGEEIERHKQIHQYEQWMRQTKTRNISTKSGQLSETLITEAYIERFNQELTKLGAQHIRVELVKSRTTYGVNKHIVRLKDVVTPGVSPVDVFSEGEHRIVALAAFLADVTGRPSKTPFIFDDPITSLDQRYEEHVINRLIELSQDRQVLIFTHRLSFLGIMSEKAGDAMNCISIRRESWGTGDVGDVPIYGKNPKGALNILKNERVRVAENILNEHGSETYYPLAKSICSDFRIIIERTIENVFLADVIQRHRRQIKTLGGEVFKLVKITKEDCQLVHDMMTKYSCYEHSQTPEAPVAMPPPDELRADIETMLIWHDEFKGRQV